MRVWARIIGKNPYVAVIQLNGGCNWGRKNLKWRILGEEHGRVDARFATPRATREGAMRTRFVGMAELFRGAPCAVVYGSHIEDVNTVIKRAEEALPESVLVGGRFGDSLIHARQWREVIDSDGEIAQYAKLLATIKQAPQLVRTIEAPTRGLADVISRGGRHRALAGVLGQHTKNLEARAECRQASSLNHNQITG